MELHTAQNFLLYNQKKFQTFPRFILTSPHFLFLEHEIQSQLQPLTSQLVTCLAGLLRLGRLRVQIGEEWLLLAHGHGACLQRAGGQGVGVAQVRRIGGGAGGVGQVGERLRGREAVRHCRGGCRWGWGWTGYPETDKRVIKCV